MVGIGGSGMSGAAALLLKLGADVSGSDLASFDGFGRLVSLGARITFGHHETRLDDDVDLVVRSAAIPDVNPELISARRRGIRVIKYAELLGELMSCRAGVAVAGTHGKSTTSAMCVHLFRRAGLDPSFVIGARCDQLGGSSGVGEGPHFIAESCEFDRSFLSLRPRSAAILNVERDHLDCYRDLEAIIEAFRDFAGNVAPDGLLVVNADDGSALRASAGSTADMQTFGFGENADYRAVNLRRDHGRYSFEVLFDGSPLLSTRLTIPGMHNVANALAAIALARHAGASHESIAESLPHFGGVCRRLTYRGQGKGVVILDDYAHHPTEIQVTIEAARYRYEPKRTWVVFQPHQHSRTRHLLEEFACSFTLADEIIVPDVYGARESDGSAEECGSAELVSRIHQKGGRARYLPTLHEAAEHVARYATEGDLVMTMGAGDVWKVADELVERFCEPSAV